LHTLGKRRFGQAESIVILKTVSGNTPYFRFLFSVPEKNRFVNKKSGVDRHCCGGG
jgi:hypothetical protein